MPVPRTPPPPPPVDESPRESEELPEMEKRNRTAKFKKLEEAVSGVYMMAGGALSTLPPQVAGQRVAVVGLGLATHRDEIADAWVDLAEDDKRVLKMLESLTSFSGWGKVIGVHLLVVGASVPGVAAVMPQPQPTQPPQGNGAAMDMESQMFMAELFRQMQSATRAQDQGGEPQFAQAAPPPPPPPQQHPQQQEPQVRRAPQQQPPPPPPARPRAGMPSAADMGVSIPDAPADFPSSGAENVRG